MITPQRKHWEDFSSYETFFTSTWQTIYKKTIKLVDKYIDKDAKILDVGCGSGAFHDYLHQSGYKNVHGIDFSFSMIEQAKKHHPYYTYEIGDALALPLSDDSYDAVFTIQTIRHVPVAIYMIQEMVRVCKPDGHCIINELNGLDNQFRDILFSPKRELDKAVFQYLIPVNLERMIRRYGVIVYNDWKSKFFLQPMYIIFKKNKVKG